MSTFALVVYTVSVVVALVIGHVTGYQEGKRIGDYKGYNRCLQEVTRQYKVERYINGKR